MTEDTAAIEVVFATPEKQEVVQLEVPIGTLIHEAVRLSGIDSHFPGFDTSLMPVGVWNEVKSESYVVQPGDRIEIYRSLVTNAKEARRKRAHSQEKQSQQKKKT